MPLPLNTLQNHVIKFVLGTDLDIAAYEAWLVENPLVIVSSTVLADNGGDGPTLIVTYRSPA